VAEQSIVKKRGYYSTHKSSSLFSRWYHPLSSVHDIEHVDKLGDTSVITDVLEVYELLLH